MRSTAVLTRDAVMAAVDRYRAALADLVALSVDGMSLDRLSVRDLFAVLDAMQTGRCQTPGVEHEALRLIGSQATPEQIGTSLPKYLADRLRIRPGEARRRVADAEMLAGRTALTGEPLQPVWPATAAAQRAGHINAAHVAEIRRFFTAQPGWVDAATRDSAEANLAEQATKLRPDELRVLAERLADCVNPDGNFTDSDRARRRGITIGRQDLDGMSPVTGWLTPELRAGLDAVLTKWAAPGMCNPNDESPTVDEEPSADAADHDGRTPAQRNHDGLNAMCRSVLASGALGSHHGLPVSIVVSTTLTDLESAAGIAHTGGGAHRCAPVHRC